MALKAGLVQSPMIGLVSSSLKVARFGKRYIPGDLIPETAPVISIVSFDDDTDTFLINTSHPSTGNYIWGRFASGTTGITPDGSGGFSTAPLESGSVAVGAVDEDVVIDESGTAATVYELFLYQRDGTTDSNIISQTYTAEGAGGPVDIPSLLFPLGTEGGGWWPTDDNAGGHMIFERASTGTSVVVDGLIGYINDQSASSNGTDMQASSSGTYRPTWRSAHGGSMEFDGYRDRMVIPPTGSMTGLGTNMTFMCAVNLNSADSSMGHLMRADSDADTYIGAVYSGSGTKVSSVHDKPSLGFYVDGAYLGDGDIDRSTFFTAIADDTVHLVEVRGIDPVTYSAFNALRLFYRSDNSSFDGHVMSPLFTSHTTSADLDSARQFYVDNHGVTLA